MKKISILLLAALVVLGSCGKIMKPKLANETDTVTYFIGVLQAKGLKQNLKESDYKKFRVEVYSRAYDEVFAGDSIKFNDMQMQTKIQSYIQKLQTQQGETNMKASREFLEKNKKTPGVVVLPSGVQYLVIKEGTGPKPDSSSMVSVNYKGTLIDGQKFDSNEGQGGPLKMPVTGGIKGWNEALLKMNVGAKWKIFIPSELAYGEQGARGSIIKPNMALIFEVELLGIEEKPKDDPNAHPAMPNMPPRRK